MPSIRKGNHRRRSIARRAIARERPTIVIRWAARGRPARISRERPLSDETLDRIRSGISRMIEAQGPAFGAADDARG